MREIIYNRNLTEEIDADSRHATEKYVECYHDFLSGIYQDGYVKACKDILAILAADAQFIDFNERVARVRDYLVSVTMTEEEVDKINEIGI